MEAHRIHASETAWVGTKFDRVIDNNGSMDELYQQINDLVRDHQVAKVDLAA
jgi:dephospho-CoA kinase